MAADLIYKSVLGLCLIITRAARYLPKPTLNIIPSLCLYYDLYGLPMANAQKFVELITDLNFLELKNGWAKM